MELLIKRAQKGDEQAFMDAIDECMPQMYKVAKSRLKNDEDIGDAVQETILAAFSHLKTLREPRHFKTWLIKILINKCNDIVANNNVLYVENFDKVARTRFSTAPCEKVGEKIDFERLLNHLSADYRLVVVLYYVNRMTIKEMSEVLGEKEGTIKARLSRARQQLKNYYLAEHHQQISDGEV